MFYDIYCELCQKHGLTPSGAATKIGFNRASVTMWKNTGKAPKQDLLVRIADYFGVSVDYLLGKENAPTETGKRIMEDFKAAFFEGYGEDLPEEEKETLWEDAREYAKFKMLQKKQRKD